MSNQQNTMSPVTELANVHLGFMTFFQLYEFVLDKQITGELLITWDRENPRILEWIERGKISPVAAAASEGKFLLKDGAIYDALIESEDTSGEWDSFKTLMQFAFGIGCSILPSTRLIIREYSRTEAVRMSKRFNLAELVKYLSKLENEFAVADVGLAAELAVGRAIFGFGEDDLFL